jgi:hypothetical protein
MMRRVFFWVTNIVMMLLLLIGVAAAVAWPVSYFKTADLWLSEEVTLHSKTPDVDPLEWTGRVVNLIVSHGGLIIALDDLPMLETRSEVDRQFNDLELRWSIEDTGPQQPTSFYIGERDGRFDIEFPLWVAAISALLVSLLWVGLRAVVLRFRHHRVHSRYCLHCGHHFDDPQRADCPECGAARPSVTVSRLK